LNELDNDVVCAWVSIDDCKFLHKDEQNWATVMERCQSCHSVNIEQQQLMMVVVVVVIDLKVSHVFYWRYVYVFNIFTTFLFTKHWKNCMYI